MTRLDREPVVVSKGERRRHDPGREERGRARSEETRARIIDAALQQFAECGYERATIREIAAHAGVNSALIGYYFAGKEDLWKIAVTLMFERLREAMNIEELMPIETRDGAAEMIRRYVRFSARHPEHARIIMQESIRGGDKLKWVVDAFVRDNHGFYLEVLGELQSRGIMPQGWTVGLIYILHAACQAPYNMAAEIREIYGTDMDDDAHIEAHIDMIVRIALGPRPEQG